MLKKIALKVSLSAKTYNEHRNCWICFPQHVANRRKSFV